MPVTPTASGLIFSGDLNGDAFALNADDGKVLWRNAAGAALGGGVITYESAGHQRVAVAAGPTGNIWPVPKATSRVVVYGLP